MLMCMTNAMTQYNAFFGREFFVCCENKHMALQLWWHHELLHSLIL